MKETDPNSAAELDAALRAFGEAWARGDAETLRSLLSPSYTHNDASGAHLTCDEWSAVALLEMPSASAPAQCSAEQPIDYRENLLTIGCTALSDGNSSNE